MPFGGWYALKILMGEMETLIKSKPNNQLSQLITAWIEHLAAPSQNSLDALTNLLNEQITTLVPLDRFGGTILQGHESAVRQDALIMLSGGFLKGNSKLVEATATHDHGRVAEELMRSLSAAIRFVRLRIRREIVKEQRRVFPFISEVASTLPIQSYEEDLRTIERVLMRALREHRITLLDQKLARAVICDGENYKKVSRWLQISKSQGYRRLKRAVKVLQQLIDKEY